MFDGTKLTLLFLQKHAIALVANKHILVLASIFLTLTKLHSTGNIVSQLSILATKSKIV